MPPSDRPSHIARREDYVAWCRQQAEALETERTFDRAGIAGELRSLAAAERNALFESVTALMGYRLAHDHVPTVSDAFATFEAERSRLAQEARQHVAESPCLAADVAPHWERLYAHGRLRAALLLDLEAVGGVDPDEEEAVAELLDIVASSQQVRWLAEATPEAETRALLREAYRNAVQVLSDAGVLPDDFAVDGSADDIETLLQDEHLAGVSTARFPDQPPWSFTELVEDLTP